MPGDAECEYRVVERSGPGARAVLRAPARDGARLIVLGGYRGPEWPEPIAIERIERIGDGSWQATGAGGMHRFEARALDRIELRPGLYEPLHRPFALGAGERLAARCLLALLRLPGGARLLRAWHARRAS